MNQDNYYEPLSEKAFDEIKEKSIEIWQGYDDTFGYATDKISRIKDLENFKDNGLFIIAMFDIHNTRKLITMLSAETKRELQKNRLFWKNFRKEK